MAAAAPSIPFILCSELNRAIFSMTTIASSTTSPVARVSPKSVTVLIVNPAIFMMKNVPMSEIGMVAAGISVARASCKKMKITRITRKIAVTKVITTSLIDSKTKSVVLNAICACTPGGKDFESSAILALTAFATLNALAVGNCSIPKPVAF